MLDQWLLALTIFLEARGEPPEGQYAVANVVMNRLADKRKRWGKDLKHVALAPKQFSCFNDARLTPVLLKMYHEPKAFADAMTIADHVLNDSVADNTFGANHYFADTIEAPTWADSNKQTCKIGHHLFYRL